MRSKHRCLGGGGSKLLLKAKITIYIKRLHPNTEAIQVATEILALKLGFIYIYLVIPEKSQLSLLTGI